MIEWTDDSEKEAADDEQFFKPWAEAMVRAELSRGQVNDMWDRVKVRLDDLGKVELLLEEVFGANAQMIDEESISQPEQEQ